MDYIDEAESLIRDYYERAFGDRGDEGEFTDLTDVGLMYTHYYLDDTFSKQELKEQCVSVDERNQPYDHQVSVNLLDYVIRIEINGKVVWAFQCNPTTLLAFLRDAEFDSLTFMPEDAHPAIINAIRG